jgi:hypothetical protein
MSVGKGPLSLESEEEAFAGVTGVPFGPATSW